MNHGWKWRTVNGLTLGCVIAALTLMTGCKEEGDDGPDNRDTGLGTPSDSDTGLGESLDVRLHAAAGRDRHSRK